MADNRPGRFYGVGLGPGDPELLTLKAQRVLNEVSWIYHPADASGRASFAARILAQLGLAGGKLRPISLCMSREPGTNQSGYQRTALEIAEHIRQGQSVAWAAEGDPLFYSTFLYLRQALLECAPDVEIEVVPGVTSIQAASARAAVPVAWRDEKVAVVPATYGIEHLPRLLTEFATVFLLKVHLVMDQLVDLLARIDTPPQTWYLENVGTDQERIVTDLRELRGRKLPYFSLVILRRR